MLSIAKLGGGQEAYYLDAVALGVEDYYVGVGEAPGYWVGSGSGDFGLAGEVEAEDLRAVLSGFDPRTGDRVAAANRRLPGFDATFSAPKSVSSVHALGSDRVRAQVAEAHEVAVAAAVGYLERRAAFVRRGHNGLERVAASGFVAAGFRHRTSRAGDPQLHTHVLIANLARGHDGRWGALDGRGVFLHKMDAGAVYQAQLRAELTRLLGVEWNAPHRGLAELAGVPVAVLRAFSRRRLEIEAALATRGESSARAANVAALATRRAKQHDIDGATLQAEWADRAAQLGFGAEQVRALIGRSRRDVNLAGPIRAQLGSWLTDEASTFDRRHVIRVLCEASRPGADVAELEQTADRFLADSGVVRVAQDAVVGGVYSTEELMFIERRALDTAASQRRDGTAVVDLNIVEAELAARPSLAADQKAMVRALTTSGAGVEVVVGAAGTGKTFALDAARAAWQASGYRVIGVALAARAAQQLEAGAGIPSFTIASLRRHLESSYLPSKSVVVVDEAGMVGTRALDELFQRARRAKSKVVLVGDHRQLPEIQAGGLFGALARQPEAIHLTEDRRHRDPDERAALAALRAGRVRDAVARLTRRGRITTADNADLLRRQLVADWHHAVEAGQVALILARRRVDVADLNRRARYALIDSGYLDPATERTVGGIALCEGDWVAAGRNRRSLGVINGDLGVVVTTTDNTVTVRLDRGPTVELPAAYVADHVQHGYAVTIHKAQGATCDITFVLGDESLALESGYTALSRGREHNQLYAMSTIDDPGADDAHGQVPQRSLDIVAALRRSEAQQLAVDHSIGIEL